MLTSVCLRASGADYVFHTASPFFNDAADPQKELVDPAVNGTRNVMTSVAKNRHVGMRIARLASASSSCRIEAATRVLSCPCLASSLVLSHPSLSAQLPCTWGSKLPAETVAVSTTGDNDLSQLCQCRIVRASSFCGAGPQCAAWC